MYSDRRSHNNKVTQERAFYLQGAQGNTWSVDIETDSIEATEIYCAVARNMESDEVVVLRDAESFHSWYRPTHKIVGHNFLSFDMPTINRLWGAKIRPSQVVDTLVLSYLYNPRLPRPVGYKGKGGPHSLEAWGYRVGEAKIDFHDFSEFTEEMLTYCIQDTLVCAKIHRALTNKMREIGFSEMSCKIEHRFRWLVDKQEARGFKFDRLRANMFYLRLRTEQYTLEREIQGFFPAKLEVVGEYDYRVKKDGSPVSSFVRHEGSFPKLQFNKDGSRYRVLDYKDFNIGSPQQRAERLLELGWKPSQFTPKGSPKVDEDSVIEFAEKSGNKYVGKIADWLVHNGRANMVKTWLNNLEKDDCIHGAVQSCGAGSRRCTHSSPNTANIPSVYARFGVESRSLWVARSERVLVGADASGLEGRVFIHYLGSKEAEEFMLGDPHSANAKAISEAVGFEVSRSATKNLFYARLYGASDKKLGSMLGSNKRLGEKVRSAIDSNIPGFEALVESIGREYDKNSGRLLTVDGGFVTCPSPHAAINYKFQSAGAIMMKQALIRFHEMATKEELDFHVVGNIHDEWQIETVPGHADRIGALACSAMTVAGEDLGFNIKLEGEYKVGKNWAATH